MPYLGKSPARGLVGTTDIDANAIDGTLTKDALIGDYSDVTITASDLIMYGDATDSNNTKRDTVQGILDLAGGGAFENIFYAHGHKTFSSMQSISTGSWTVVEFETEVLDQGSDFDLSNNKFVAPSDGKYIFYGSYQVLHGSGSGTDQRLALNHYNSSDSSIAGRNLGKTTVHEAAQNGSMIFTMSASDYINMAVYQASGSSKTLEMPILFGWRVV